MKNYKNYISLGILIFVMCGIIFAFSTITKNNNLSASNSENQNQNTTQTPKFEFVPARQSLNSSISFENNFGGSNFDEVNFVYYLNDYYLIGSTLSTDKYFENNKSSSVYVLICDSLGNAKNVYTLNFDSEIKVVDAKIFSNSIYILIDSDGTKLVEFNLSSTTLKIVYSINETPLNLVVSSQPIVVTTLTNKTNFHFLNSNKTFSLNYKIENIVLGCDYANGTLLIFNANNAVFVGILNLDSFEEIIQIENSNLITFNITNLNFVFVIKSQENYLVKIYDLNFESEAELKIPNGTDFKLFYYNNQHYLTYLTNNYLNMISFCNHGDTLNSKTILSGVASYNFQIVNNLVACLTSNTDGSISLNSFNFIGNLEKSVTIPSSLNLNITSFELNYNLNFFVVGNFKMANSLITNNFGSSDIFVCEIKF